MRKFLKINELKLVKKTFFNIEKRISFYKIFSAYLEDGFSIQKTLEICYKKFKNESEVFGNIINEFIENDKTGKYKNFGLIMKDYISDEEFTLLSSSKNSTLSSSLNQCIYILETKESIKNNILLFLPSLFKLLMGYGSLLLIYNVAFLKMNELIENLKNDFPDVEVNTDFMAFIDNILYLYSPLIFSFFVLYIIFAFNFKYFIKSKKEADFFYNFPVIKMIREIKSISFLMSLQAQIKNKISIKQSIKNIKEKNKDHFLSIYVKEIDKNISAYKSEGLSLKVNLFSKEIDNDIEHYSKLSGFTQTIEILSKKSIENLINSIKKSVKISGFISLLIMSFYLLTMVFGQVKLVLILMNFS